ncbi:DNA polymerase-3 subunit beta [Spinactinospora alkalitolerans]|uniref:DNA polymerase-3 subunit beta n=1 Tax=Spinactinospora alkalitolerans TaxID=687207 RepID=A0A852U3G7_9ACTN|nr:DNA polymerase III subunit beta [Spinactinospora alkalitolerans]NYE50012.1 DNA polymerase-3 subunit beta [Spinactinospora alkalitolerans]
MTTTTDTTGTAPRFTAGRAALADALTTVGLAVGSRPAVPLLGAVLLEGHPDGCLKLSGFDYETAITVTVPDAATAPGRVLVDHAETVRMLSALVKGKSKRKADAVGVTIAAPSPDAPAMTANGYTVPLTAYPLADYPTLPEAPPTVADLDRERFVTELGRVLCAVGRDDTLPILTGVNMEVTGNGLTLAATDRYRLAVAHLPTQDGTDGAALVSGALLAKLARKLTGQRVTLGRDQNLVSLDCGNVRVVTRPIYGEFVKYRKHLPAGMPASFTAERAELLALTAQAEAILSAKRQSRSLVGITVTPGTLTVAPLLSERADDVAAPELTAKTEGYPDEPIRFAFDSRFLTDAVTGITGETATVHTGLVPTRPAVITETGQRPGDPAAYRHLLMPVRLS